MTIIWYDFIEVLLTLRIRGIPNVCLKSKTVFWAQVLEFLYMIAVSEPQSATIWDTLCLGKYAISEKGSLQGGAPGSLGG